MISRNIYKKILEHFGINHQIQKTIEECSELICALSRIIDGRSKEEDIITELADVQIMINQLKEHFGIDKVNNELVKKLLRIDKKMAYDKINNT